MAERETTSVQGEDRCPNPYCRNGWVERSDNESGAAPPLPCGVCRLVPAPSDEALLSTINGVLMGAMYNRALQAEGAPSVSDMARAVLAAIDLPRLLAEARAKGEAARTAEIVALLDSITTADVQPSWCARLIEKEFAAHFNPEAE